jgi:hypothetical protein
MGREGAAFRQRRSSNHHLWKCHPPLCHPDPDSCHVALDSAACAPFREERRMKCINATNLNRNPGERSRGICGAPRLPHKGLGFVSSHTNSTAAVFSRRTRLLVCGVSDTRQQELFTRQDIKIISLIKTLLLFIAGRRGDGDIS